MTKPDDFMARIQASQTGRVQEALEAVSKERETFLRIALCLLKAMRDEIELVNVEGHPAISVADLNEATHGVDIRLKQVGVSQTVEEGEPDEITPYVAFMVAPKNGNGLVVPEGPRIQLP